MENPTLANRVRELIAEQLYREPESVFDRHRLKEDLGADSLDVTELGYAIEDEFGIAAVDTDDAEKWGTVLDVVLYVQKYGR